MKPELFLHEEVLLLALSDEKGTIETGAWYQQAVGGAVLSELLLAGRVRIEPDGKKSLLRIEKSGRVGNELVDEWLEKMARSEKTRKLDHWLSKISNTKNLKARVARGLVERGILEEQADKVLFFFNRTRYPEASGGPERKIRERLHTAIFRDSRDVDARTVALLSITKHAEMLGTLFDKRELKGRKQRIEELIAGDTTGQAAAELITAIKVAVMTACLVPIIVS